MFTQKGEVCNQVKYTSLPHQFSYTKHFEFVSDFINYQELCSSQALELGVFADKYHPSVSS